MSETKFQIFQVFTPRSLSIDWLNRFCFVFGCSWKITRLEMRYTKALVDYGCYGSDREIFLVCVGITRTNLFCASFRFSLFPIFFFIIQDFLIFYICYIFGHTIFGTFSLIPDLQKVSLCRFLRAVDQIETKINFMAFLEDIRTWKAFSDVIGADEFSIVIILLEWDKVKRCCIEKSRRYASDNTSCYKITTRNLLK